MQSSGTFAGVYRINGRDVTDSVAVSLTDYTISLHDAKKTIFAREVLALHPVCAQMFSHVGTSERMRRGVQYSISGDNIGAFTFGPLGHPGDGEYDYRPVKRFTVSGRFTSQQLALSFEGATDAGRSRFCERTAALEPWAFEISFIVPRAELFVFLQIGDGPAKYFEDRLNGCGNNV